VGLFFKKFIRSKLSTYSKSDYFGDGKLSQIAEEFDDAGVFLGGPSKDFESVGKSCLVILLKNGLYPDSKVLDVGCGMLRGGYWIINFLNPNCFYGIEPNQKMLELGKTKILDREILENKKPQFDFNEDFNFDCFSQKFDFVITRSVWTHSSKKYIAKMLDSFIKVKTEDGVFLSSYYKGNAVTDYKGDEWVGRSHKSDIQGTVAHSFDWIKNECQKRRLNVTELKDEIINNQIWLRITAH